MLSISPSVSSTLCSSRQPKIERPIRAILTAFSKPVCTIFVSYVYKRRKARRPSLKSLSDCGGKTEFMRKSMRFFLRLVSHTSLCANLTALESSIPSCFAALVKAVRSLILCSSIQLIVSIASVQASRNTSIPS